MFHASLSSQRLVRMFAGRVPVALVVLLGGLLAPAVTHAQEILIKSGERLAFMGDSITQDGAGAGGYVTLVVAGLAANDVKVTSIPAGISGHKSNQMLERLGRDVLDKKPQWMTLSCGVNDVWHGANGVPLEQYKKNITAIVDQCQAAGVKVVILTSTMISEDAAAENNRKLAAYNAFLRSLAAERKCPLADLNAQMQEAVQQRAAATGLKPDHLITRDGVHMNPYGNQMMARGVLRALGLSEAQLEKARAAWLEIPNAVNVDGRMNLTLAQFEQLSDLATRQKMTLEQLLNTEFARMVQAQLQSAPANGQQK